MTFSFDTVENFDDHIAKSIPNYKMLNDMIVSVASFVTLPNTKVIDIGAGTCELIQRIDHPQYDKIAIEPSTHLLYQNEQQEIERINTYIEMMLDELPDASLILSIFTLQFIPTHRRQLIVNEIYNALVPNGAFIWAEKVRCDDSREQDMMTFAHYDLKQQFFTPAEILQKERDIRTIMRPNTTIENLQIARNAGFSRLPSLIWKMFNFECYLFRKEP